MVSKQLLGGFGDLEGGGHVHAFAAYASAQPWVCLLYLKMLVTGTGQALDHSPDLDGLAAVASFEAAVTLCVASRESRHTMFPPRFAPFVATPPRASISHVFGIENLTQFPRAPISAPVLVASCVVGMPGVPRGFRRMAAAAFAWWVVWLFPSSSLVPTVDLMVERRTYMAGAAVYACLDASMFGTLQYGLSSPSLRIVATVGTAGLFVTQTWRRMHVMGSEEGAWKESVLMYPRSARAHHNLGTILMSIGDDDNSISSAAASFNAVLNTNPADEYALNNLGTSLLRQPLHQICGQIKCICSKAPAPGALSVQRGNDIFLQVRSTICLDRFMTGNMLLCSSKGQFDRIQGLHLRTTTSA